MRRLGLIMPLAALSMPAVAQTPPDNAEVRAAAQAFDDAQLHGDRAVLERMLAPDYLLVHGSGRVGDKKDFIDGFTDPNSHLEPFEISDRLFLRPTPDTAIVGGGLFFEVVQRVGQYAGLGARNVPVRMAAQWRR